MNYPLAFTNNSTIFAHETNLSYFSTPRPLSSRLGAFFYPKHSPVKKFPKFFPPKGRLTFCCIFGAKNYVLLGELFSIFSVRKIMRVKGSCRSANGGGCPFLPTLYISNMLAFTPDYFRTLRHSQGQKGIESGQKVAKMNFFLIDFV